MDDPCKKHRYITTFSGVRIELGKIHPEQIKLEDIVASLSMQARYMGHASRFYSVAEHSVLVAHLAHQKHPDYLMLTKMALAHDFAEAYTGDHPSPMKEEVPEIRPFEKKIEGVICQALGLFPPEHALWHVVKGCDLEALHIEACQLFSPIPDWAKPPEGVPPMIQCLTHNEARAALRTAVRAVFGAYDEHRPSILDMAQKLG